MASVLISSSTCLVVLFISTKIPTDVKRTDHESCHEYRQVSGCLEIKVLPTETLVSWVSNSPTLYLFANMRHGPLHAAVKHTTAIPSLFSFTNPSKSAYWNNVKNRMNLIIHIIRWKCNKEMIPETHHEDQQLSVERSWDKRISIMSKGNIAVFLRNVLKITTHVYSLLEWVHSLVINYIIKT